MSEVIRPRFGSKQPLSPISEVLVLHPPSHEGVANRVKKDIDFLKIHRSKVHDALNRVDAIIESIFPAIDGDNGNTNVTHIRFFELIRRTSLEGLCAHVLTTEARDWKARPSFYGTVIVDMSFRIKMIGEIIERLKK